MSIIFYALVIITVVFTGAAIYRISSGVREYNRDREQKIGANFGVGSQDARDAEFDLFLLRWSFVFAIITIAWGILEGTMRLLS